MGLCWVNCQQDNCFLLAQCLIDKDFSNQLEFESYFD